MNERYKKYLYQLKADRERAIKLVLEQGIIICYDEKVKEIAKAIFLKIAKVFIDEITCSTLSLIYLYNQSNQSGKISASDGYSSISRILGNDKRVSAIGISIQALQQGEEYATLVFLHELTHIFYKVDIEHGEAFHKYLDKLISQYNYRTGAKIKNDYFGLPDKIKL